MWLLAASVLSGRNIFCVFELNCEIGKNTLPLIVL